MQESRDVSRGRNSLVNLSQISDKNLSIRLIRDNIELNQLATVLIVFGRLFREHFDYYNRRVDLWTYLFLKDDVS